MAELTRELRMRHSAMLNTPQNWPLWPYLPMKRYVDGLAQTGFSVTADYPLIVLKGYPSPEGILLQIACEDGLPILGGNEGEVQFPDQEASEMYERHVEARYQDVDGMLDAGWRID